MKKIKKIGVLSAGKVLGILYAILGIFIGLVYSGIAIVFSAFSKSLYPGIFSFIFGIGAIITMPIIYGIMGFIGGILTALLYNLIAKWIGGIEVETG
ncbi:hypothetical protein JXB41_08595 [Candidatus Woesearchaeota archaeon]|nr:hypothetical protein [Candidatus Woesearchaeota archaeon]